MSIPSDAGEAGSTLLPASPPTAASAPAMVRVWDPLVRVFHWSLVGLFVVAYASSEEMETLHLVSGFAIVSLLILRVMWGFIGSGHARFSDFVRSPRDVLAYIKLARQHRAPRYLGHNPAGGTMVIALMAMLAGVCLSGHLMTTTAWWGSETMEDLHGLLVNLTIGLIGLHLLGNLFSSREKGENLTMSMMTGLKRPE
jgi:cytochrome b